MSTTSTLTKRVAVIGAGMAGATCARLLADAGIEVALFDKSRGVGGRMSTRRAQWAGGEGSEGTLHPARFDHGAPGFIARSPEFMRFVEPLASAGLLARWTPVSETPSEPPAWWVPTPDMPSLCRALSTGLAMHTECPVDAVAQTPEGWRIQCAGATVAAGFDSVIIAIPPLQAAPLLAPHQADWSQRARSLSLLPGWVLMAVTGDTPASPQWEIAQPAGGPLALIIRNDTKPGRSREPGVAQWVAHASARWSEAHLEDPPDEVQAALQTALTKAFGHTPTWHHATVHRWRYATAPESQPSTPFWWDTDSGLGVCGDALGGGGVEGAWRSAHALGLQCIAHLTEGHTHDAP